MRVRTRVIRSNGWQTVRLPSETAFPEGVRDVVVRREGRRRTIVPANAAWNDFFEASGMEFPERVQPAATKREAF